MNGLPEPVGNPGGIAATYAAMANLEYDIPLHPFGLPLRQYIAAGVGFA
ncbi:MAG: hypothetical protein ABSC06_20815 [Rhodopila sp.]